MMGAVMDSSLPSELTNLGNTCFTNGTLKQSSPTRDINKHEKCSKNCHCQYHNIILHYIIYVY